MSCKKLVVGSLLVGTMLGLCMSVCTNSLDYKIRYLRRKVNCLNRKINRALKGMSEENLKKYKEELVNGYENIKTKIENLTIKDIKDAGNELFENILDSIKDLKEKLITYTK